MSKIGIVLEVTDRASPAFDQASQKAVTSANKMADAWAQKAKEIETISSRYSQTLVQDTARVEGSLGSLRTGLEKTASTMSQAGISAGLFGTVVGALANPIAILLIALTALVAGAAASAAALVDNAKEVKNLMAVSGLGAEAADNLGDTFKLLGVDAGTLTTALFKMGQEIDSGGQSLTRLGVSIFDTNGRLKTEGDLLLEVRDKISGMGSASERSAALIDIFGRSGRTLASVMSMSNESFEKYRKIAEDVSPWNDKMQEQGLGLSRAMTLLSMTFEALTVRVGSFIANAAIHLVNTLTAVITKVNEGIDVVSKFLKLFPEGADAAKKALEGMQVPLKIQLEMEKAAVQERLRVRNLYVDMVVDSERQLAAQLKIFQSRALQTELEGLDERRAAQQEFFDRQAGLLKRGGDQFGQQMQEARNKHREAMDAIDRQAETVRRALGEARIQESIEKIEQAAKAAGEEEKRFADAFKHDLPELDAATKKFAQGLREIGQNEQFVTIQAKQATIDRLNNQTATYAQLRTLDDNLRIAQLNNTAEQQQASGNYFGFLGTQFKLLGERAPDTYQALTNAAAESFSAARNAASDLFFDVLTLKFDELDKVVVNFFTVAIPRAISNFLADVAVKKLFEFFSKGAGESVVDAVVGGFGKAIGAAGGLLGGAFDLVSSFFSAGGIVSGGRGTDRVPAMLTPGEVVIPADVAAALGLTGLPGFTTVGGLAGLAGAGGASGAPGGIGGTSSNAAPPSTLGGFFGAVSSATPAGIIGQIANIAAQGINSDAGKFTSGFFGPGLVGQGVMGLLGQLGVPGLGMLSGITTAVSAPLIALAMLAARMGLQGGVGQSQGIANLAAVLSSLGQISGLNGNVAMSLVGHLGTDPNMISNMLSNPSFPGVGRGNDDGNTPAAPAAPGSTANGPDGSSSADYARGGTVRGAYPGQPVRVTAHAGEEFLGVGQYRRRSGGTVNHFYFTVESGDDRWIRDNAPKIARAIEGEMQNRRVRA